MRPGISCAPTISAGAAELHFAHPQQIPFKKISRPKVKLPKRSEKHKYDDQASLKGRKFVRELY